MARKNNEDQKNLHKDLEGWARYREKARKRAFVNRKYAQKYHGATQRNRDDDAG